MGKNESWLLCLVCLPGVCDCCVAIPLSAMDLYITIVKKPHCEPKIFVLQQQQILGRIFGTSKMQF